MALKKKGRAPNKNLFHHNQIRHGHSEENVYDKNQTICWAKCKAFPF